MTDKSTLIVGTYGTRQDEFPYMAETPKHPRHPSRQRIQRASLGVQQLIGSASGQKGLQGLMGSTLFVPTGSERQAWRFLPMTTPLAALKSLALPLNCRRQLSTVLPGLPNSSTEPV